MEKLVLDIGFANLVVEKSDPGLFLDEFYITLQSKETGAVEQDIVLVRAAINESTGERINHAVECIVWAASDDENYTDKFFINQRVDEDD